MIEIYKLYKNSKISYAKIAKLYNVDPSAIHLIMKGKNWKHLNLKERFEQGLLTLSTEQNELA